MGEPVYCKHLMFEIVSFPCCSGPNDYVFVNFVDHGAPGLVFFPNDLVIELIELVFLCFFFAMITATITNCNTYMCCDLLN